MTTPLKNVAPSPDHQAAREAMVAALIAYDHLTPDEMLAIAAQVVGTLIAMQDQRSMSADDAMTIVTANLVEGNASAIRNFLGKPEGRA
jgi:hypothetical protein